MESGKYGAAVLLLITVFLSGCRTTSPFTQDPYFSAMGEPAHLVLTVDVQKPSFIDKQHIAADSDEKVRDLLERTDRISVSLYDPTSSDITDKPDFSLYTVYGALEGNFPQFLTNTALLWNPEWEKIEHEETHYFKHKTLGLSAAVAKRGVLLFSNDDYMEAYRKTISERKPLIDRQTALRMQNATFGFYAASPNVMLDIGLSIPTTVLMQLDSLMLVIEQTETSPASLSGLIVAKSPKLANTISILLKSSYISERRRNKLPFGDLTNLIVVYEDKVEINHMELTQAQLGGFSSMFGSLLATTGGIVPYADL